MTKCVEIAVFSRGIKRKDNLKNFLSASDLILNPFNGSNIDYVVGWGRKKNTEKAKNFANMYELQYFSLEDGFIHSTGQGVLGASSCSLVKDSLGIYYDATQASDIELMISAFDESYFNSDVCERSKHLIERIIKHNITKYNNAKVDSTNIVSNGNDTVLVVDQTAGDMSLEFGYVKDETFRDMLQAAIDENPNAQIYVKTHPDVIAGKKKSCIGVTNLDKRITLISDSVNPLTLLKKINKVYVATSQMGFEALLLGKKVVCFGVPFYAGWGLTEDRADKKLAVWGRRKGSREIEELFAAAYIHYTSYIHPDTQKHCELEDILTYFELQNNKQRDCNIIYCLNFTRWKQSYVSTFLSNRGKIVFVSSAKGVLKKGIGQSSRLITWASKNQEQVDTLVSEFGITPWQVEDGFIRSIGLGTDLTAPASLVLDKTGIYYDPSKPSDLEVLLQTKKFTQEEFERAEALKSSLLKNELSKYNLGGSFSKSSLNSVQNQKIILIPGQVEGDASIIKGCIDIDTNTALIKAVRKNEPDAYLIYKPHPDVVSGNRKGKVDHEVMQKHTDLVLLDTSITDCLAVVDEVHTMTSLVGFEGLMRELTVVCYGLPFYSNWGLTIDRHQLNRRTRKLTLNELVAGTLIDYPLYINWQTQAFTTPEVIVEQLREQIEKQGGKQSNQVFWLSRFMRKFINFIRGL